jgi:hypothetical protein
VVLAAVGDFAAVLVNGDVETALAELEQLMQLG